MLTWLTRKLRWRAAAILAVVFAICIVAPSVSLAFADGSTAAHCLTDDHRSFAKTQAQDHEHGSGTVHSHPDKGASVPVSDEGKSALEKCCGIFCVSALPAANHLPLGQMIHGPAVLPVTHDHLASRGPDRINRPPIASLSL